MYKLLNFALTVSSLAALAVLAAVQVAICYVGAAHTAEAPVAQAKAQCFAAVQSTENTFVQPCGQAYKDFATWKAAGKDV